MISRYRDFYGRVRRGSSATISPVRHFLGAPGREVPLLFLVALSVRLPMCFWAWDRVKPTADGEYYHVVAERIAQGLGYTWAWPDGAVTYAAHYPVGYPALMSVLYRFFGPIPGLAMVMNALVGSLAIALLYELNLDLVRRSPLRAYARWSALIVSGLLIFSPTLVGYTPALMTESVVGALLSIAAWLSFKFNSRAKGRPRSRALLFSLLIVCVGGATFLRPQSILLAPILGYLCTEGTWKRRMILAGALSVGSLMIVAPWVQRNCEKMDRCVFVSANGGWNLLIGTFPEGNGAWVGLTGSRVPVECREVFKEAEKDVCFRRAALRRIRSNWGGWLGLISAKWRATFDYTAAAAEHLFASGAISESGRDIVRILEIPFQRLLGILALAGAYSLGIGRESGAIKKVRFILALIGLFGFLGGGAIYGWIALVLLSLGEPRKLEQVGVGYGVSTVAATALIYAIFFGAGRYFLPLLYACAPLASLGIAWFLCRLFISTKKIAQKA